MATGRESFRRLRGPAVAGQAVLKGVGKSFALELGGKSRREPMALAGGARRPPANAVHPVAHR